METNQKASGIETNNFHEKLWKKNVIKNTIKPRTRS